MGVLKLIQVHKASIDGRILKILLMTYPITLDELIEKLKAKRIPVEHKIRKFRRIGLVHVDVLPDKIYLRLRRTDIHFIGPKNPHHRKMVKHRIRRKVKPYEGMMFR